MPGSEVADKAEGSSMPRKYLEAFEPMQNKRLTPRQAEAMAFSKAATMMEEARKEPSDTERFSQALRFNQLFWTILQADIAGPGNMLPNEVKANIMSLGVFVDKQTTKAHRSRDGKDLDILISINRNLAAGLREETSSSTQEPGLADGT